MHASSGQENITCGETARGPTGRGGSGGSGGEERLEGNSRGRRGAKGAEQQTGIFFGGGGILGRKRKRIKNELDSQHSGEGRQIIQRQSEKMEA